MIPNFLRNRSYRYELIAAIGRMRVFGLIWLGQVVSMVGSGLTAFALGVWVYQRTGSATQLALIWVFATLPQVVVSPLSGALVDRWERRRVMMLSDSGAGVATLIVAVLLFSGRLYTWHIYLAAMAIATCNAFQRPAYMAAIPLLVPERHLGRANGMVSFGGAAAQIISPILAGLLMSTVGLEGVVVADLATLTFAIATLASVRIPAPLRITHHEADQLSLLRQITAGGAYLRARPGLIWALLLTAVLEFLVAVTAVLRTPLVLSFASPAALGTVMSIAGIGMLAGSLTMTAWGGPKRRMHGVLGFLPLFALSSILAGLRPSTLLVAIGSFGAFFSIPIITGCAMAVLQSKVAPDVQGRIFSAGNMFGGLALSLAYLIAGPLADYVFEPLLLVDGPLAGSVGRLIGVGPGRGIGLLFIVAGALMATVTLAAYFNPRLRLLEDELATVSTSPIHSEGAPTSLVPPFEDQSAPQPSTPDCLVTNAESTEEKSHLPIGTDPGQV